MSSMKPRTAVAGGTGGLGAIIVDAIQEAGYPVIVLTRFPNQKLQDKEGITVRVVDYTNESTLLSALQDIDTVISCIATGDESFISSQISLLDACVKSKGVRRFAPSEWVGSPQMAEEVEFCRWKATVMDAVKKSGLEYTHFAGGILMNYLAIGNPNGLAGLGTLRPFKFGIDIENFSAAIPGNGNEPFTLTRAEDIGKFVAASLSLDRWPEFLGMGGEVTTCNEIVRLAEEIREKPFTIKHLSNAEIEAKMQPSAGFPLINLTLEVALAMVKGDRLVFDLSLNRLAPQVQPMKLKEFLEFWWRPKSGA